MVKIVNGVPVEVPDDDRITPEMKDLRTFINGFLQHLTSDTEDWRRVDEMYRKGRIEHIDWYTDPSND